MDSLDAVDGDAQSGQTKFFECTARNSGELTYVSISASKLRLQVMKYGTVVEKADDQELKPLCVWRHDGSPTLESGTTRAFRKMVWKIRKKVLPNGR